MGVRTRPLLVGLAVLLLVVGAVEAWYVSTDFGAAADERPPSDPFV